MTATQTSKTNRKPERTVHVHNPNGNPKLVQINVGNHSVSYWIEPIPADFGAAFSMRKMIDDGSDVYHVHLDPRSLQASCTCKGGTYAGHCKHAEAIVALIKSGKIALPKSKPASVASTVEFDDP